MQPGALWCCFYNQCKAINHHQCYLNNYLPRSQPWGNNGLFEISPAEPPLALQLKMQSRFKIRPLSRLFANLIELECNAAITSSIFFGSCSLRDRTLITWQLPCSVFEVLAICFSKFSWSTLSSSSKAWSFFFTNKCLQSSHRHKRISSVLCKRSPTCCIIFLIDI